MSGSLLARRRVWARLATALDGDVVHHFRSSPIAMLAGAITLLMVLGAVFAPWIALHNPFDLASLNLMDSFHPPVPLTGSEWTFPFGTDDQGRDIFSAILFGMRLSLEIGVAAVLFAMVLGVLIGLVAGYAGGAVDALLMRVADVQLTFPAILVSLLVDGVVTAVLPAELHRSLQVGVLVFAIGISNWPQFSRTVRGSTLVERNKEYIMAARVIGVPSWRIMVSHILPNVLGPVLIIATLNLGFAIITEATLSFLGVGLPPTQPSLGTLINTGNNFLFSGDWWMTVFPGATLVVMVLAINLLGDWLRDALNPRLR